MRVRLSIDVQIQESDPARLVAIIEEHREVTVDLGGDFFFIVTGPLVGVVPLNGDQVDPHKTPGKGKQP